MAPPRKQTTTARAEEVRALELARDQPNSRTAADPNVLKRAFADHLQYSQGKDEHSATGLDRYFAVAYAVRDRMMRRWIQTQQRYYKKDAKRVYYLSLEFLMGKALENNLINLGLLSGMRSALSDLGLDLDDLLLQEPDAGLGNGGLGRLAACFLDSLATLAIPAYGYGIRYEFGIFDQDIRNGYQVERPRSGCASAAPGRSPRPEYDRAGPFYGRTEHAVDERDGDQVRWVDARHVLGMPYDMPIAGYQNEHRQHAAAVARREPRRSFDLADFNAGDYLSRRRGQEHLRDHLQGALPQRPRPASARSCA